MNPTFASQTTCAWPATLLMFLMMPALAAGQAPPAVAGLIRGQVEGAPFGGHLWVELAGPDRAAPANRSPVAPDGSFEFRSVPEGSYRLRILSLHGEPVREEYVQVHSFTNTLSVSLPRANTARPLTGTVSAGRLRHKVPRKALAAVMKAQKYSEAGRRREAALALEEAIRRDPEFVDAYGNLGVQRLHLGQVAEAIPLFERAIALEPGSAVLFGNYAYALASLERRDEAEGAARRAVELDGAYAQGRYILGALLAAKPGRLEEAEKHLRMAAERIPSARLRLARVLAQQGRRAAALAELQGLLDSGAPHNRQEVERWQDALRKQ